jgi:protocatechuate 3,4-dioxygenase beta subunit
VDSRASPRAARLFFTLALGTLTAVAAEPLAIDGRVVEGPVVGGPVVEGQSQGVGGLEVRLLPVLSSYQQARSDLQGLTVEPAAVGVTEGDGSFVLRAPEPGFWSLAIEAPGRLPIAFRLSGEPLIEPVSLPPCELEKAEELEVIVRGADGRPAAGAVVRSQRDNNRPNHGAQLALDAVARTDAAGRATLPRAAGETRQVTVWFPGYAPAWSEVRDARRLEVELDRGAGITRSVRVIDSAGEPVGGVILEVESWPVAATAEDGLATVTTAAGDGELGLVAPDGRRFSVRVDPGRGIESPFEFVLPAPDLTAGMVLDGVDRRPIAGALVFVSGDAARAVRTGPRGGFELATGGADSRISAVTAGYLVRSESLGLAGAPLTLLLDRALSLPGRVEDEAGAPVAGAIVTTGSDPSFSGAWTGPRKPQSRATSGADGEFVLRGLSATARYVVTAKRQGYASRELLVSDPAESARAGGLVLTLDRGTRAFGRVLDRDGLAVAGAEISLAREETADSWFWRQRFSAEEDGFSFATSSNGDGDFAFAQLPAGRFVLTARAPGFAPKTVLGLVVAAAGDAPGDATDLGSLILDPGVTLNGRVVDPDGAPVAGALLQARAAQGTMFSRQQSEDPSTLSEEDGLFAFADRREGEEVILSVTREGYVERSLPGVRVALGETLEVVLQPAVAVRGRVLSPDGQAVSGARVEVVREGLARGPGARFRRRSTGTETDDLGRFELRDVEPGTVRLAAEADAWLRVEIGAVELAPGRDLEDFEITLRAGGRVEGRVIGPDGRPLPHARVVVEQSAAAPSRDTTTDSNGDYALEAVEPGRRLLTATAGRQSLQTSEELEVELGVNRLDFYLTAGVEVSGRALADDGSAVDDAVVLLHPSDGQGHSPDSTRTAGDGSFRLENVSPGIYDWQVMHADYSLESALAPLEVAEQPLLGLQLRMARGARLAGVLTGLDPPELASASVMALREPEEFRTGSIDSDGSYQITNLGPGEWFVWATAGGRRAQEEIEIPAGARETRLDLDFASGLVLRGRVLRQGAPQPNLRVRVASGEVASSAGDATDHQGRFELHGLEAASYELTVRDYATGFEHRETVDLRRDDEITIELSSATLSGTVVARADGTPVAGASVTLTAAGFDETLGGGRQGATTDRDGRFMLTDLAPGSYQLTVQREGHATASREIVVGPRDVPRELEIELDRVEGLVLRVFSHLGTPVNALAWAALDAGGRPVAGGTELATSAGLVRLTTVPDGAWTLLLSSAGSALDTSRVQAPAEERRIQLTSAARLALRIEELGEETARATLTLQSTTGERFRSLDDLGQPRDEWVLFRGRVELDDLPPGRWILTVTASGGRRWERAVTLEAGANEVLFD